MIGIQHVASSLNIKNIQKLCEILLFYLSKIVFNKQYL